MVESERRRWFLKGLRAASVVALTLVTRLPADAGSGRAKKRDGAIDFINDLESGVERARAAGKPVYLAFGAAWCPVCRRMETVTLLQPPMQALAEEFIWVNIDNNRNMTLAREWGVEATPTIFLLDPEGHSRRKIVGGASAEELSAALCQFLAGLGTEAAVGEAEEAEVFQNTQLTVKPNGFRGKSICFSHVGYGPLKIRGRSPFQSLRLGTVPRTPSTPRTVIQLCPCRAARRAAYLPATFS
jgi:thiol-disulfide isomerase/thioredoxin